MTRQWGFVEGKLLSELSTFRIGGPARFFIEISHLEEMGELLAHCHRIGLSYLIVGKGSNTLFDDRGFDGLVILNKIAFCEHQDACVSVGAGFSFALLGVQTARKGWSGLEFASGIPASVGGAIYMNAGANGKETCDSLVEVTAFSDRGELEVFPKAALSFSYRHSSFQQRKGAIVSAKFQLDPLPDSRKKQLEIVQYRMKTQPYGEASAGCVFRNPPGASAGALIEQCGLKGVSVGRAQVSLLHANFIINAGGATAQDVLDLASLVETTVKEKRNIALEREIRCVPYTV